MKDKSKLVLLTMFMLVSGALVSCGDVDTRKTKEQKEFEKMVQETRDLDETYHPTPEQARRLHEYYENAQKKLQEADSANQVKRAHDSTLKQAKER